MAAVEMARQRNDGFSANLRRGAVVFACALLCGAAFVFPALAATHEVASGGSIMRAIDKAVSGDTIRIAPGIYRESINIAKAGLTITSATAPGGDPDVVVESSGNTVVTDPYDTVWRGIAFRAQGKEGPMGDFTGFTGRVEYCRFDPGEAAPGKFAVVVSGGATFHGTIFANQNDDGEGVRIRSGNPTFTYCRFENLQSGAILVASGGARFLNCLFVRNGHIVNRGSESAGVEIANSILFLNTAYDLFPGESSSPVALSRCVYTPSRNSVEGNTYTRSFGVVRAIESQEGATLDETRTASPRFVSLRRRGLLNLGIDDNRCIPLWSKITEEADKYGYPVTIAAHISRLTPELIELLNKGDARGHEVASHGMSHAPLNLEEGLLLSYYDPNVKSAYLSLGDDRVLKFFVDEKLVDEISLGEPGGSDSMRMSDVAVRLRKSRIKAELSEASYGDVPAGLLANTPHLDLMFKNFSPTLGLQGADYTRFEIAESKKRLDERLSLRDPLVAIVYPYNAFSKIIAEEVARAGYLCGRAGSTEDTFSPYVDGFDPYCIYAENIKNQISPPDIAPDKMREALYVILDFINDSGAAMSLYSHAENELTLKNWHVLLKALHDDDQARPVTLLSMAETIMREGKRGDDGRYYLTPGDDLSDYHLREDSPLRGAGKNLGLTHDFEGNTLPSGNPSIGLYQ